MSTFLYVFTPNDFNKTSILILLPSFNFYTECITHCLLLLPVTIYDCFSTEVLTNANRVLFCLVNKSN